MYKKEDHYVNYIEMVANPATMFELTKEGENPKHISELLTKEYLDMKPNDFTRSKLIEMFADIGKKDDNGKASKIKNKQLWDGRVLRGSPEALLSEKQIL